MSCFYIVDYGALAGHMKPWQEIYELFIHSLLWSLGRRYMSCSCIVYYESWQGIYKLFIHSLLWSLGRGHTSCSCIVHYGVLAGDKELFNVTVNSL